MSRLLLPFFLLAFLNDWALTEGLEIGATNVKREPRHLKQKKLCRKYGICQQQGGYGGGYGGYEGYGGGYQQQGYGGYPPINIGISQSQSSANSGGGGYANGYYPNNYQYNGGFGGGNGGYGGYGGGFRRPEFQGGQGFNNGQGGYNSQFNGNYYNGGGGGGGGPNRFGNYGFQDSFGNGYYDEAGGGPQVDDPVNTGPDNSVGNQYNYNEGYDQTHESGAGAYSFSGTRNS